ncbi:transcriptional regulator [Desulfovibrio fairfieldensis]|uniref:Transcriptional regulator n=1 Tax=Desulfovibrio fairfieldensis TaxID=44742 RepID=A0A109W463_9BACT|nr:transcriptional regulator [Desulfovibrio fairfieldensis]AMD89870.1 transcriptional regulator [Desulfovibrio fairfieldensis]
MTSERKTMTLNLTKDEMDILDALATRKDVSKTSILKAAIKLYYIINLRIESGEKIFSEDDKTGEKAELLLL